MNYYYYSSFRGRLYVGSEEVLSVEVAIAADGFKQHVEVFHLFLGVGRLLAMIEDFQLHRLELLRQLADLYRRHTHAVPRRITVVIIVIIIISSSSSSSSSITMVTCVIVVAIAITTLHTFTFQLTPDHQL
jgi:hypothetical protein